MPAIPARTANESLPSLAAARLASVLIVDDEPGILPFLAKALAPIFSLVETAENTLTADALRQRCHFDLIICNVRLSGRCGIQWVSELREQGVDTAVIFMSMYADLKVAVKALRAGAQDFILKPVDMPQMLSAVTRCLDRRPMPSGGGVLRRTTDRLFDAEPIIGACAPIRAACDMIKRIAARPSTVLIEGESGTGKELAARAVHGCSGRSGPFVPVNCGGLTGELLESELFGHIKGAFTGATQARDGLFSFANKGTLFLDEIGDMPLSMQTHLLRVLEEHTIRPVGSNREVPVNVRIIAATHRNLKQRVDAGLFREDLYYRLHVLSVRMPPLRERLDDIAELAHHFAQALSAESGLPPPPLEAAELQRLQAHRWPGNIRELRNVIERSILLGVAPSQCLDGVDDDADAIKQSAGAPTKTDHDRSLQAVERQHILTLLRQHDGNKSAAARTLGISRKTLERKYQAWKTRGLLPAD